MGLVANESFDLDFKTGKNKVTLCPLQSSRGGSNGRVSDSAFKSVMTSCGEREEKKIKASKDKK